MAQQVWTFLISGGQSFKMTLRNNPTCDHDGGVRTIWKMVGPPCYALQAQLAFQALGATVQMFTETESEEQLAERQLLVTGTSSLKAQWTEELARDLENFHGIKSI